MEENYEKLNIPAFRGVNAAFNSVSTQTLDLIDESCLYGHNQSLGKISVPHCQKHKKSHFKMPLNNIGDKSKKAANSLLKQSQSVLNKLKHGLESTIAIENDFDNNHHYGVFKRFNSLRGSTRSVFNVTASTKTYDEYSLSQNKKTSVVSKCIAKVTPWTPRLSAHSEESEKVTSFNNNNILYQESLKRSANSSNHFSILERRKAYCDQDTLHHNIFSSVRVKSKHHCIDSNFDEINPSFNINSYVYSNIYGGHLNQSNTLKKVNKETSLEKNNFKTLLSWTKTQGSDDLGYEGSIGSNDTSPYNTNSHQFQNLSSVVNASKNQNRNENRKTLISEDTSDNNVKDIYGFLGNQSFSQLTTKNILLPNESVVDSGKRNEPIYAVPEAIVSTLHSIFQETPKRPTFDVYGEPNNLQLSDLFPESNDDLGPFIGRKWLFHALYQFLSEKSQHKICIISGARGSGKTSIISQITPKKSCLSGSLECSKESSTRFQFPGNPPIYAIPRSSNTKKERDVISPTIVEKINMHNRKTGLKIMNNSASFRITSNSGVRERLSAMHGKLNRNVFTDDMCTPPKKQNMAQPISPNLSGYCMTELINKIYQLESNSSIDSPKCQAETSFNEINFATEVGARVLAMYARPNITMHKIYQEAESNKQFICELANKIGRLISKSNSVNFEYDRTLNEATNFLNLIVNPLKKLRLSLSTPCAIVVDNADTKLLNFLTTSCCLVLPPWLKFIVTYSISHSNEYRTFQTITNNNYKDVLSLPLDTDTLGNRDTVCNDVNQDVLDYIAWRVQNNPKVYEPLGAAISTSTANHQPIYGYGKGTQNINNSIDSNNDATSTYKSSTSSNSSENNYTRKFQNNSSSEIGGKIKIKSPGTKIGQDYQQQINAATVWPKLQERIKELCGGNFLYLRNLHDLIENGTLVIKNMSFKVLPQSINEIYSLLFGRAFPIPTIFIERGYNYALSALAITPLTIEQFKGIFDRHFAQNKLRRQKDAQIKRDSLNFDDLLHVIPDETSNSNSSEYVNESSELIYMEFLNTLINYDIIRVSGNNVYCSHPYFADWLFEQSHNILTRYELDSSYGYTALALDSILHESKTISDVALCFLPFSNAKVLLEFLDNGASKNISNKSLTKLLSHYVNGENVSNLIDFIDMFDISLHELLPISSNQCDNNHNPKQNQSMTLLQWLITVTTTDSIVWDKIIKIMQKQSLKVSTQDIIICSKYNNTTALSQLIPLCTNFVNIWGLDHTYRCALDYAIMYNLREIAGIICKPTFLPKHGPELLAVTEQIKKSLVYACAHINIQFVRIMLEYLRLSSKHQTLPTTILSHNIKVYGSDWLSVNLFGAALLTQKGIDLLLTSSKSSQQIDVKILQNIVQMLTPGERISREQLLKLLLDEKIGDLEQPILSVSKHVLSSNDILKCCNAATLSILLNDLNAYELLHRNRNDNNEFCSISAVNSLSPLLLAASINNLTIFEQILRNGTEKITTIDSQGWSALHWSVFNGSFDIVKCILAQSDCHFLLNLVDNQGRTPLHLATLSAHPNEMLSLMLEINHSTDILDKNGMSVLDTSVAVYLINLIIKHPNITDLSDLPQDLANINNNLLSLNVSSNGENKSTIIHSNRNTIEILLNNGFKIRHFCWKQMSSCLQWCIEKYNDANQNKLYNENNLTYQQLHDCVLDLYYMFLAKIVKDAKHIATNPTPDNISSAIYRYEYALRVYPTQIIAQTNKKPMNSDSVHSKLMELKLQTLVNVARCQLYVKDIDSAMKSTTAALELNPVYFDALYHRALVNKKLNKIELALYDIHLARQHINSQYKNDVFASSEMEMRNNQLKNNHNLLNQLEHSLYATKSVPV